MDGSELEKGINSENGSCRMFRIRTYNKIDAAGLAKFDPALVSISDSEGDPHAILLRSHDLKTTDYNPALIAIGRAGAGTNNIDVQRATKAGVVVFNTPGANANAVKELVLAGMLMAARNIISGASFLKTLDGSQDFEKEIESGKSKFKGYEIKGKRLGIIGLGAIGTMIANDAVHLGMDVEGYDPYISVDRAWGLSRAVKQAKNLNSMLKSADFISVHVPLTPDTREYVNYKLLQNVKPGAVLLNFARGDVASQSDVIKALDEGLLGAFVTDFPDRELIDHPKVICTPHLGASTAEAEQNCSLMIVDQIQNYLRTGDIVNSVNFPNCTMDPSTKYRITILNENVPNMVGQITTVLAEEKINIAEMINKSRDNIAYNIVDIETVCPEKSLVRIRQIDGVIAVRALTF